MIAKLACMGRASAAVLLIVLFGSGASLGQTPCPPVPPVNVSAASVPEDVCIPSGFGGLPIRYFDDYSWRTFIAMVWPAQSGARGVPDASANPGSRVGPLVFETLKAEWEVFTDSGVPSMNWATVDTANPCGQAGITGDDLVLGTFSFSKLGNLGQAGFGDLVGPLIMQNRTYVRFSTALNKLAFDQIIRDELYKVANQKNIVLANGAITIKASWIDMTNVKSPDRFHTRMAWLYNPVTNTCARQLVGLVGLHIVQKTKSRPQWIWSSFEHVDNVPPVSGTPMSFHDGGTVAMPKRNPFGFPPPLPVPPPFNVQRLKPIHPDTVQANNGYRAALRGTKWEFYQLVVTQWPVPSPNPSAPTVDPKQPGTPDFTFPGTGATTAFANTTLETFDQGSVNRSCMACHDLTGTDTDFVWVLATRGVRPPTPSSTTSAPTASGPAVSANGRESIRKLRGLLEFGRE